MSRIDTDKEKKALKIQRDNGLMSEYQYQIQRIIIDNPGVDKAFLIANYHSYINSHYGKAQRSERLDVSFESCHRCRRDREHLSCINCPKYNRRNLLESLELGMYASIVGLLLLIVIFYGKGIG